MKIGDLKKYLATGSREQLVAEIVDMFSRIDLVKDYYKNKLNLGYSPEVSERYKAIIKNEFFPTRGFGEGRLAVAKKAVTDYKKVSDSKFGLADVMLCYVETGTEYTKTYGDINEAFYSSMERMYANAVRLVVDNEMQAEFQERCSAVVDDASGIGWGFYDILCDIYVNNFDEEEDFDIEP